MKIFRMRKILDPFILTLFLITSKNVDGINTRVGAEPEQEARC